TTNCVQETLDDQRLGEADRIADEGKHDQDLGDAEKPAGHMHCDAGDKVGPDRVDHAQVSIDRIDRAEHGALSFAGETIEGEMKNALSATAFRRVKAGEQ